MKRILVITTWWPNKFEPGKAVFSQVITDALVKYAGCQVTVINPIPFFPKIKIGFIPDKFKNYALLDYKEVKDHYTVFRPKYYKLPSPLSKNTDWISYYRSVLKVIKKENIQFDIIHSHGLFPDSYGAYKVAEKVKKPLVVHLHDTYIDQVYLQQPKKIDEIFEYASMLLPVSNFQAECVKKIISNTDLHKKIKVVYNGIENIFFENNFSEIEQKWKLVFVGGLLERKGITTLLHALKKLSVSNRFYLDLYGLGELDYFSKMANDLGLEDYVQFKGNIDNNLLPTIYKDYSIFVLPSFFETFGIVLIEAMACGLPVVSSDITAIPEIVKNGINGFLVPPGNVEMLSEAIKKAFEKKWDQNEIRQSVEKFKIAQTAKNIDAIYNEILTNKNQLN